MTSLKSKKGAVLPKDGHGNTYLTPEYVKALCLETGLYETPHLNEKLYLHFKGFSKIQGLTAYTNLKALWLENNGIESILGLDHMTQLRMLYLQQNLISEIRGLATLKQLVTLNLSNNRIKRV